MGNPRQHCAHVRRGEHVEVLADLRILLEPRKLGRKEITDLLQRGARAFGQRSDRALGSCGVPVDVCGFAHGILRNDGG
jgi:hypothetical protein